MTQYEPAFRGMKATGQETTPDEFRAPLGRLRLRITMSLFSIESRVLERAMMKPATIAKACNLF